MTVIIAQDSSDAIRGIMKRWFIEPKPGVFVGTINRGTRESVIDYIRRNSQGIKMLIIYSSNNCQGYNIEQINDTNYRSVTMTGLHLVSGAGSVFVDAPF